MLPDDEENRLDPSPMPAGGPVGPPAQQQQPARSKFVNFSQYLNANRDSAQRNANQVAQNIQQQGQAVQQGVQLAQQNFQQQANANQPVQYVAPAQGRAPTAQLATGAAQQYTGPQALSAGAGWADLQKQAANAQDAANLGVQGAYATQPGGNRRFSQALTGFVGADQLADARNRYGKLSDYLNQANTASQATAADRTKAFSDAAGGFKAAQDKAAADRAAYDVAASENRAKGPYGDLVKVDATMPAMITPEIFSNMNAEEVQQMRALADSVRNAPNLIAANKRKVDLLKMGQLMQTRYGRKAAKPQFKHDYAQGSNPT